MLSRSLANDVRHSVRAQHGASIRVQHVRMLRALHALVCAMRASGTCAGQHVPKASAPVRSTGTLRCHPPGMHILVQCFHREGIRSSKYMME
jgi:hypothetical protein